MREDTAARKVYTRTRDDHEPEYLTYDFSLTAGDTLSIDYLDRTGVLDTIQWIELANGERRRQFIFQENEFMFMYSNNMYIEGVGGSSSLLFPFDINFEGGADIGCLRENEEILYDFQVAWRCETITSTGAEPNIKELVLSPNPTSSVIQLDNLGDHHFRVDIRSADGRLMYTINNPHDGMRIDLSHLPGGVYVLIAVNKSGSANIYKVIKI